jgi:PAS domain-containing protein
MHTKARSLKPTEPLPLYHSWPILEAGVRFELGAVSDHGGVPPVHPRRVEFDDELLTRNAVGQWECDVDDGRLTWSSSVYDLFGLPREHDLKRANIVEQYCEPSRAAMERLRAYAIKHRRGFTLDAEIQPINGARRWMRLITVPVCVDGRVVRLEGLKRQIGGHRH